MSTQTTAAVSRVRTGFEIVDDVPIFYRESGQPQKRAIVLLHGFPASSYMYRDVLGELGDAYYVVAPDYPGFGDSASPDADSYDYTFDNLSQSIASFLEQKGITEFVLGMQDYGAPVGYRIATQHPEKVRGLIVMNGNAYEEGFHAENTALIAKYWKNRTPELELAIVDQLMSSKGVEWQYTAGTRSPNEIPAENWIRDYARISRPGQQRIQLNLLFDYQNNVRRYPQWHAYLEKHKPPTLIAWGANDPIFTAAGAHAYRQHLKEVDFHLFDTGHFVLEEDAPQVISAIRDFLAKNRI